MSAPRDPRPCTDCGRPTPRDEMFGPETDLLCPACAGRLHERLSPKPTGRLLSPVASGTPVLTVSVLVAAAALFAAVEFAFGPKGRPPPAWFYALLPQRPLAGEAWRLFTSAFFHGGWIHLLFNGFWVWELGRAIETTRGRLAFAALFVGSALGSSALQWIFSGPGIGLSGVLYALAGYLWMRRARDPVAAAVLNPGVARLLAVWFVICIVLTEMGTWRIANWAHGGGAAWGLAAGWISQDRRRWPLYGALALATAALAWAAASDVVVRL